MQMNLVLFRDVRLNHYLEEHFFKVSQRQGFILITLLVGLIWLLRAWAVWGESLTYGS